jgi:hypothetical protein
MKIITGPTKKRVTKREQRLQKIAIQNGWTFQREVDWDTSYLRNFHFFETRPIERKTNAVRGVDEKNKASWEIADIVFDEGAMLSLEIFHTTVQVVRLEGKIPEFIVEKEGLFSRLFDRVKAISGIQDSDLKLFTKISDKFLIMGQEEDEVRKFFSPSLLEFLEKSQVQHIESNGEALMIFKYLHIAPADDVCDMVSFSKELLDHMDLKF